MRTIPEGFHREDLQGQVDRGKFAKIDWVGMNGLTLPIAFKVAGQSWRRTAKASVFASLDSRDHRGIHMSRLYARLQQAFEDPEGWRFERFRQLSESLRQTQNGLSKSLKLMLEFDLSVQRKAMVTEGQGLRTYPVSIELVQVGEDFRLMVRGQITYSSTCPCSAGLARELNYEAMAERFLDREVIDKAELLGWMKDSSSMAGTPHSQRSLLEFELEISKDSNVSLITYLDQLLLGLENTMATPVQTLVKREDEKAFAGANATNLMFCEDAARRAKTFLGGQALALNYWAKVSHFESLHAHDAVAEISGQILS